MYIFCRYQKQRSHSPLHPYLFRLAEQEVMEMWVVLHRLQKDNHLKADRETETERERGRDAGWHVSQHTTKGQLKLEAVQPEMLFFFYALRVSGGCWISHYNIYYQMQIWTMWFGSIVRVNLWRKALACCVLVVLVFSGSAIS